MDPLKRRRVWITRRRGAARRRANYCVNWIDADGRTRRLCYASMAEADQARATRYQEINSGLFPRTAKPWDAAMGEYGQAIGLLAEGTRKSVLRTLSYLQCLTAPRFTTELRAAALDRYFQLRSAGWPQRIDRAGRPVVDADGQPVLGKIPALHTLHRERRELAAVAAWLVERGYLDANPVGSVKLRAAPRRRVLVPPDTHWLAVLDAIGRDDCYLDDPQAWHLLVLLGVVSGYRQQVLLNAYFGLALPLSENRLTALATKHPRGFCVVDLAPAANGVGLLFTYSGKTSKENVIGLPPAVNSRLASRIGSLPAGAGLFPWGGLWQPKGWARIQTAAGVRMKFHSLRAVAATQAAIRAAQRSAQRMLEHGNVATTAAHYLDAQAVATAVAIQATLPELPPLPAYGLQRKRPSPAGAGAGSGPSGR